MSSISSCGLGHCLLGKHSCILWVQALPQVTLQDSPFPHSPSCLYRGSSIGSKRRKSSPSLMAGALLNQVLVAPLVPVIS